jgi:hypothetical protein
MRKLTQRYPPKLPGYLYGYRSKFALKTKETFSEANVFSASLLIRYGILLMIFRLINALLFRESHSRIFLFCRFSAGYYMWAGCNSLN